MPTRNVNLTDHFNNFIETATASGRFGNASEVVREGLRLLEQQQAENAAKLQWLRNATQEALDSLDRGEGITFESVDDFAVYLEQLGNEVMAARRA